MQNAKLTLTPAATRKRRPRTPPRHGSCSTDSSRSGASSRGTRTDARARARYQAGDRVSPRGTAGNGPGSHRRARRRGVRSGGTARADRAGTKSTHRKRARTLEEELASSDTERIAPRGRAPGRPTPGRRAHRPDRRPRRRTRRRPPGTRRSSRSARARSTRTSPPGRRMSHTSRKGCTPPKVAPPELSDKVVSLADRLEAAESLLEEGESASEAARREADAAAARLNAAEARITELNTTADRLDGEKTQLSKAFSNQRLALEHELGNRRGATRRRGGGALRNAVCPLARAHRISAAREPIPAPGDESEPGPQDYLCFTPTQGRLSTRRPDGASAWGRRRMRRRRRRSSGHAGCPLAAALRFADVRVSDGSRLDRHRRES